MSCRPNPFARNDLTGAVWLSSHRLPQPSQFARFTPISFPQLYLVVVPARAAYSHSASLGRRYSAPVCADSLVTRVGKLELRVPRDREGRFSTELFERYQRSEQALVGALAEMYIQGVSTRKVKAIAEELCGHRVSASTISRINKRLD